MATNQPKTPSSALDKINLGLGVLAILLLTASIGLGYVPPTTLKVPDAVPQYLRWAGWAAMAGYVLTLLLLNKSKVGEFAGQRNTRSGANSTVQVLAVVAILAAVNWFGARHHNRFDLTQNKAYSLSEQTIKIVKDLKEPVNVTLFVKSGDPYSTNLQSLWKEYQFASNDKIKLDVVDIDREPTRARQLNITSVGSTVLQRGERKTTISGNQEQDLTSALLKVTQSGQKVIYFVTGHQELKLDDVDQKGLSYAKDALEKQNYKLDTLSLFSTKKVPADAALVVVAGPSKPFLPDEVKALKSYVDAGGRAFVALQPQTDPKLDGLLGAYGIQADNDLVLDPRLNTGDLAAPAVQKFSPHTITSGLSAAYFPGTRSLTKLDKAPNGAAVQPLVETSETAWGETNMMERNVSFDAGKDKKGPVPIILLAEKDKSRLIVSGNTLFMSNAAYVNLNNGDLFLNALNWMADEQSLVSIPPKDNQPKTVDLLPGQYQMVFFGCVLLMPLLLLIGAGVVWWRRR
jgi:ABC-type uncharacterized transport system involved in gliding motility auxiliary subunit